MINAAEKLEQLRGTVDEVIFSNSENGYIVISLDCDGELISVNGELGDIVEGEKLELYGNYVNSVKYGRQFKAQSCRRMLPETPSEIRKYIGSGIIKGVGPSLAKKLVDAFGKETLDIIENDPLRLSEIKGVTSDRALYISAEFRRLSGVKNVIEFLQKYNISPAVAMQVWRRYDSSALATVRENPYVLCDEEIGVDFEQADAISADLGIDRKSLARITAGIIYVLRENSFSGHTCLPAEKLEECVCGFLGIDDVLFYEGLSSGIEKELLNELEISDKAYIYLSEFYTAERYIAKKLSEMMKLSPPQLKDYSDEIEGVEFTENITYEALQKAAINGCLGNSVFILTGGPGTGKTTTLNGVIRLFKSKKKVLALCAPTGRAAKRMSDLTGEEAKTIHRLLEVDFSKTDRLVFKRNERNPLRADVIIIDEMSMVDALLFESLLRAIKRGASLIMVGDSNQLPSVGAGNILRDIISSGEIPMVELKEIFRQAAESLIVTNAHRIVKGELPELDERKNDFFFMECNNEEDIPTLIISLAKTRLPNTYGYSPIDDIQILTPTRMGAVGTRELNNALQLALNPPDRNKREVKFFDVIYRVGDKVMQIKNDYDIEWQRGGEYGRGIFNGDIGIITDIDRYSGNLTVNFDGRLAAITPEMLKKLDHAYAVTIHKSQGSEYNAVILPLTSVSRNLLYRNLLYTGVTRAKNILIIIGKRSQVATMVENNRKTLRYSCVKPLLMLETSKEKKDEVL